MAGKRGLRVFPDTIKELPRGWLTSKSEDNQAQLAPKKISKDTQKPQVPTGSFVFYIITLIPDIYGLGHFLTQGEGTYTYVKYTCEAMKIFVFLTHHDALANMVQHLQGF